MKLSEITRDELLSELARLFGRKTTRGSVVNNAYKFIILNVNDNDEFMLSRSTDFTFGWRKNKRGYAHAERFGVMQMGKTNNYIFLNWGKNE